MKSTIKIAVIGSTGKAGTFLIKELAKQQILHKTLVRNSKDASNTETAKGNVTDYSSILSLLEGCDAVISMLGMGVSPNPTNIFTTSTGNIIRAMKECGIRRYIVITGLNVNTPFDNKGEKSKMGTEWMYTHFPETTKDKQEEYDMLAECDLDWTMIRLPMIIQTDDNPDINISTEDCPGDAISATSLAKFVINQVEEDTYLRKAPFIANV